MNTFLKKVENMENTHQVLENMFLENQVYTWKIRFTSGFIKSLCVLGKLGWTIKEEVYTLKSQIP